MKEALIYSLPDCPRCTHVKSSLSSLGYEVIERSAEALERGEYHDNEALAELTFNDGAVPVVTIAGQAVRDVDAFLQGETSC